MASLSRSNSWENAAPDLTSSSHPSLPTTDTSSKLDRAALFLGTRSRTSSHTLLSSPTSPPGTSRKGRFADVGTIDGNIARASLSMPAPLNKPSSYYKPSISRHPSAFFTSQDSHSVDEAMDGLVGRSTSNGSAVIDDLEKTPNMSGTRDRLTSESYTSLLLPDSTLRQAKSQGTPSDTESNRLSFSSLYSLGSAIYNGATGGTSAAPSAPSSNAGSVRSNIIDHPAINPPPLSPALGSARSEASSLATTATDPISVTASSHSHNSALLSPTKEPIPSTTNAAAKHLESWSSGPLPRNHHTSRRSRSRTQRRPSGSNGASSTSPNNGERVTIAQAERTLIGKIGVCALDVKARSKASRNILTRLQSKGEFDVVVFGDKAILDEEVENWPVCDYLISFFSDGFPLDKAIAYVNLRKPFCINDLPMQKVLWDRRICLRILDSMGVPTPKRLEVNRDGGPTLESAGLAAHVHRFSGVKLNGPESGTGGGMIVAKKVELIDDGDTLLVDGDTLKKPFVEKPVSGDDHNIRIYFPKNHEGGGGRKLFRKIGNKSSEWDPDMIVPRAVSEEGSSYIYEHFLHVDNAEDVKAYTVGPDFCHAETRKSPVVDGLVRRNLHGKEVRYITSLTKDEATMAAKIANSFGQRICGFDLLRVGNKSYVIDVNGWSFVKDNKEYYDNCARILKDMFVREKEKRDGRVSTPELSVEGPPEKTSSHRRHTGSALKSIFKSPSLTILGGHHGNHNRTASPDLSVLSSPPLTSQPSFDDRSIRSLPALPATSPDLLPPPVTPMDQANTTVSQPSLPADINSQTSIPLPASKHSWKLKGMVAVIRHADRTPKQKFKFTFHTQPFVDLLKGHQEEVLLKGEAALSSVLDAVKLAMQQGIEDPEKLQILRTSLVRKGAWTGTKVQIKPMFRDRKARQSSERPAEVTIDSSSSVIVQVPATTQETSDLTRSPTNNDTSAGITLSRFSAAENDLILDKLQLIIKWGGEPTHSARYQSQDLGENMRNDLLLMNKEAFEDVRIFTSSERRVRTSAQIWAASFLKQQDIPEDFISTRKDLLDDSNAAKDVMDKVKKKLKLLLREGHKAPPQFAWPENMPEPSIVVRKVAELMRFHRRVMRYNFKKLYSGAAASLTAIKKPVDNVVTANPNPAGALAQAQALSSIQARWCSGEDPELFKERWEKLFSEFCDSEKVDPSKISELYDTMKFDALHNRQFLEWVFTPSNGFLEAEAALDVKSPPDMTGQESKSSGEQRSRKGSDATEKAAEKVPSNNLAQRIGLRKKSVITPQSPQPNTEEAQESYFKLFMGNGQTKAKQDARLGKLRELYQLAKVLFDFVCPQEYGIADSEKLEIGLLTSLPLLKEIVKDLEEVQASDDAKSFIYFTKESHIYTLLNCILEGGIKPKIERNSIPELDYLSHICFELYEAEDKDADMFAYSIRITISPGCHTLDPLDVQLDSKHSIGCAPRRSLTAHADWKEVIDTLRAKFHTVKLPKSFLAVNLSERHASEAGTEDVGDKMDV